MIKKHKRILTATAIGLSIATIGTVTPLAIIMTNNSKTTASNKDSVKTAKELLVGKAVGFRTISLPSTTLGKIIGKDSNKTLLETKIKALLVDPKHKKISIVVSKTIDSDITVTGQSIIVKLIQGDSTEKIITYRVKRDKTDAEVQTSIIRYFAGSGKKKIIIEGLTDLSSQADLLTAIKTTIDSDLSDDEKDALSIHAGGTSEYWTKGEVRKATLGIQVGTETKDTSVEIEITLAASKADELITVFNYFKTAANRTLYLPNATGLAADTDPKALAAIKLAIGTKLTEAQKSLIIIGSDSAIPSLTGTTTKITLKSDDSTIADAYDLTLHARTTVEESGMTTARTALNAKRDALIALSAAAKKLKITQAGSGAIKLDGTTSGLDTKIASALHTLSNKGAGQTYKVSRPIGLNKAIPIYTASPDNTAKILGMPIVITISHGTGITYQEVIVTGFSVIRKVS